MDKDASTVKLVERLRTDLGPDDFDIVDHWDADLCAIGIAMTDDHTQLVYISTFAKPHESYDYELEIAPKSPENQYDVAGQGDCVSYPMLLDIVRDHIRMHSGDLDNQAMNECRRWRGI
jgi:hypothetical protein